MLYSVVLFFVSILSDSLAVYISTKKFYRIWTLRIRDMNQDKFAGEKKDSPWIQEIVSPPPPR